MNLGEINVTSKEGEGTIFTVLLPVARDHLALSSVLGGMDAV
jgi:signal transduction histidine kinase